jgi:hypothetical protein
MSWHTKYSNLTDAELLSQVEAARAQSPVIEELAKRLEKQTTGFNGDTGHRVECPVCEAPLKADFDDGDNMFTLEKV